MWNLDVQKRGTRFTHTDLSQLAKGEYIEIRMLNSAELNEISAKCEIEIVDFYRDPDNPRNVQSLARMTWAGNTPEERAASKTLSEELRFAKTITGWCLYADEEGKKQIPFNDENKKKLRQNDDFVRLWLDALNILRERQEANQKAKEKN